MMILNEMTSGRSQRETHIFILQLRPYSRTQFGIPFSSTIPNFKPIFHTQQREENLPLHPQRNPAIERERHTSPATRLHSHVKQLPAIYRRKVLSAFNIICQPHRSILAAGPLCKKCKQSAGRWNWSATCSN